MRDKLGGFVSLDQGPTHVSGVEDVEAVSGQGAESGLQCRLSVGLGGVFSPLEALLARAPCHVYDCAQFVKCYAASASCWASEEGFYCACCISGQDQSVFME